MTVEEIRTEVERLSAEEKMRLTEALGPRACCAVMGELWDKHRTMRECMGAMSEGGMEAMMHRVMRRMGGQEAHHG